MSGCAEGCCGDSGSIGIWDSLGSVELDYESWEQAITSRCEIMAEVTDVKEQLKKRDGNI